MADTSKPRCEWHILDKRGRIYVTHQCSRAALPNDYLCWQHRDKAIASKRELQWIERR